MSWLTPAEVEVLALSLKVAAAATLACAPVALPLAWWLARGGDRRWSRRGRVALEAAVALPLVMPPVVTGYLLLVIFGRTGLVGRWLEAMGVELAFTWKAAALASAVVGFPLMVRALRLSIEAVDPGLEEAARTLGAGRLGAFFSVTLPLALPGLVTGGLLCFARALGEFGATITFAGNVPGATRTLTLAIWSAAQTPGGEAAAARLVGLSVALACAAVLVGEIAARRLARRLEP